MSEPEQIIIIQPPLVQLNTPYPSGAYLSAFFRSALPDGVPVVWHDLSIALFHRIFSRFGLTALFEATGQRALELASEAEESGDEGTAFNLRRYVSSAPLWIDWIDDIVDILCSGSREKAHEFVRSAHVPRGERMERFLSELGRDVSVDDERMLASLALADLADYITVVFDENFALIRYAESLSASTATFAEIAAAADSPVMRTFYVPLLREVLAGHAEGGAVLADKADNSQEGLSRLSRPAAAGAFKADNSQEDNSALIRHGAAASALKAGAAQEGTDALTRQGAAAFRADTIQEGREPLSRHSAAPAAQTLFLVTVPFAGCFAAALTTCREIKRLFGDSAVVCMGGGYVNTALRGTHEAALSEYVDFLSFDRGYAFYLDLLASGPDALKAGSALQTDAANPLSDAEIGAARAFSGGKVADYLPGAESFAQEEILTRTLIPDYSDIDFTAYPRVADDVNAMHRIWSDGAWLKAYLAHGCYWHRCAFCDTQLDYVCNYKRVGAAELHEGLSRQAEEKGVYGVHFVDEAAPPAALKEFALANVSSARRRLSFWGNIRFEKAFTRDAADFLAYGGLTGVSGGIEIASGEGLADINKGIDIDSLVGSCAAFKEAGVLVHAYMIYGFYNETPQMLIDSAETLRQLFAAGLIDSAFWHKFTLTRHSTVYREWQEGKHPELRPFKADEARAFADYELHFAGEGKSEKYGAPLMAALDAWMHGHSLNKSVQKWFPFTMPAPKVGADFIDKAIARYEKRRDAAFAEALPASLDELKRSFVWLGGKPAVLASSGGAQLCWSYMGELMYADVPGVVKAEKSATRAAGFEKAASAKKAARALAEKAAELLWSLRPGVKADETAVCAGSSEKAGATCAEKAILAVLQQARGVGLCRMQ